ncbi:MAG TPA: aminopeptidase N [Streptosporangiaceae bacterium]|nr:aminopeptidase N [Streptosporangiaceae bacterium]
MASNLTRDEARERARLLDVESYRVELDLTGGDLTFGSVTTVRFRCARPGASTFIDLSAPAAGEITLNGDRVSPDHFDGDRIRLDDLAEANELRVTADCAYSRSGEGMHRFTDPADGSVYLYSDLETFDAHRVYACFDQPDLKATFELAVTAPPDWLVVSNMAPAEQATAGLAAEGTASRWTFPPTPVLPTYITAVAAGPYYVVRDEHDGIPLGIFCRQSLAGYLDPDEIFEVTRQGLDFFHDAFAVRYPFGKYDQLFVPEFKAGAMENAGCVTFLEAYVFRSRVTETYREARAETILHEMAHMWFGDLVTMRWWDDLWLNESFATWAGTMAQAEATRWTTAWTTFAQAWKAWAYRQDQLPSSHPIAADIPDIEAVEVNFDGITYAKGAAVLKQLVAHVGRENFLTGVRHYFGQHAWGNATLGDLLAALEQSSGRNLAEWSKKWLEAPGVNTLRPEFACDGDGRFTAFTVLQEAAPSRPVLRPHRIAIGLYDRSPQGGSGASSPQGGTALTRRHRVELDIDGERTEVPELVGQVRPDLVLVNDDDLTYAKVRLDERSLRTLITGIGDFTDSLPAALCWAAAWDMCRDAEMAARDYVSLVLSGVDAIEDITVLQTVLRQATMAVRRFADPAWRAEGLERIARTLRDLLQAAEPGSDRQLAYAQALAGVATSAGDLELLAGLLDGTTAIEGLAIDTELRWHLLYRLASRGTAGPARIDAELARDATDAGARHAATCRAARPDPAVKQEAWNLIISGKLSNATFRATLDGFEDQDQDELLEPYAARYFDVVADIWRDWGSDMAQYFTENAYPRREVTAEAIAAADDYLARSDPAAALRRLLAEGRDDAARALRCRQRDAGAA